MIKKEEVISFVWQHILLLVSLYVMTFGVAACVRSQLGSSVISTIPYVMASAGKMLDYIPGWTIGGYTINNILPQVQTTFFEDANRGLLYQ